MIRATIFVLMATAVISNFEANGQTSNCGVNEATYPCGRRCEAVCNTPLPSFCRGIQCNGFSCRCKNGFARNPATDRCILVENCPLPFAR